jgi:ubiquinone/menaquinone biosynthesis C-methylase UbiE
MQKPTHAAFDQDVILNGGYMYTTNALLSSKMANDRLTDATIKIISLKGKRVIDVGCGDGTYTYELYRRSKPKEMVGVDAAKEAIRLAQVLYKNHNKLKFYTGDVYRLNRKFENFDVAIVRGVIHHVDFPQKAIASISKIAKRIVILEPNGYNPFLKIVEKISLYHRIHKEKSYPPILLRHWLSKVGFKTKSYSYVGFVPFFCPDGMALFMKKIEKLIEKIYLFSRLFCAVYIVLAKRSSIVEKPR